MIQTINIGTEIDLTDLLQSRMLIQANSGGGKSVLARAIMEQAFGKVPFVIFDRDGEYYTLKEKFADIVVIGGSYPDLPISLQSAALLPKEIITHKLSVVLDLSDLKSGEKQQYVKLFLQALMDLPQEYWTGYLIFIEEAHFFCGEQDKNPAGSAVRELMSGGRKKGYCGILITQRISKLHKDAAAECNNKFVGRTNLDIDMDRASKELGFSNAKDRMKLRDLVPGSFYAYGTSITPNYVHEVKINLPQTKQPKAGSIVEINLGKPTDKVLAALQKLNDLPKEAKTPIQQSISNLDNNQVKLLSEETEELKKQVEILATERDKWRSMFENCRIVIRLAMDELSSVVNTTLPETVINEPVSVIKTGQSGIKMPFLERKQKNKETSVNLNSKLGKCALAVFEFLASYPDRSFSKAQVGIATGYSPNSGGFNNSLSELNSKGLLSRTDGKLTMAEHPDIFDYLPADFRAKQYSIETYKDKLNKCEREIYEVLLNNKRIWFSKDQLANHTESKYSYTSGGFNNALSTLNTLELIKRESGKITLNPELLEI